MVQLQLGKQLSVLCKIVASLEQWNREPRWCKEPEKEQPVVLLEHLFTTGMGTKGGRTHSRPEACLPNGHHCGILLFLLVLSWSNTQQQHDVLSGAEKGFSSWELGWGELNGNICSGKPLEKSSNCLGKTSGLHTPDHQGCNKWRKIGETEEEGGRIDVGWAVN